MTPELHQWLSKAAAVAAFQLDGSAELARDDQFVLTDTAVLCFATVTGTPNTTNVPMPSRVEWMCEYAMKPPDRFIDVYNRSVRPVLKLRTHHVFVRPDGRDDFMYAGPAHLGSYGGSNGTKWTASFSLNQKLPRELWLQLGGFPAWSIDCEHETYQLGPADAEPFERLLAGAWRQEFWHMSLTRYDEDELSIFTNGARAWVSHGSEPGLTDVVAQVPGEAIVDDDAMESFRCTCGIELEFPVIHTVPLEAGLVAVDNYFKTGELSETVHWSNSGW